VNEINVNEINVNKIKENNPQFYTVFVRTFVIPFYYGSGSVKAKSYGSYCSGSATLLQPSIVSVHGFLSL
jgi:hypothetical protein